MVLVAALALCRRDVAVLVLMLVLAPESVATAGAALTVLDTTAARRRVLRGAF